MRDCWTTCSCTLLLPLILLQINFSWPILSFDGLPSAINLITQWLWQLMMGNPRPTISWQLMILYISKGSITLPELIFLRCMDSLFMIQKDISKEANQILFQPDTGGKWKTTIGIIIWKAWTGFSSLQIFHYYKCACPWIFIWYITHPMVSTYHTEVTSVLDAPYPLDWLILENQCRRWTLCTLDTDWDLPGSQ